MEHIPQTVQNWALIGFDFSTADPAAVATGGRLIIGVQQDFATAAVHGSAADSFVIRELFPTNTGWTEGGQEIQNSVANAGVATFQEREAATSPWLDADGNAVDNFMGAFDGAVQVNTGTVSGYDLAAGPPLLTFDFDAATGQRWLAQGFADLLIEVIDADGMNTTRFVLTNGTAQLVVTTTDDSPSDFNFDGVVDCDDIDLYTVRLGLPASTTGVLPNFDLNSDGTIDTADSVVLIETLVETTNGQVGTFLADFNCDGSVNVLGDAFILIGNLVVDPLREDPILYADGDSNLDGAVDVLGDAFNLVANLGRTNES